MAASVGHFDRYKKKNSVVRGGRGVSSQTDRKNQTTLVFGKLTRYDPLLAPNYRPSMKNIESTGDFDIDRRPHCKQFSKRSTSNLIAETDQEPYYMKAVNEKRRKQYPKEKNAESDGPPVQYRPLTERETAP